MKNKFNSSVLHNGHVYGLDEGILSCLDVNTGERKWKDGRYGYGQVLLAGGHLIITSDKGEVALVKASPEWVHGSGALPGVEGPDVELSGPCKWALARAELEPRWRPTIFRQVSTTTQLHSEEHCDDWRRFEIRLRAHGDGMWQAAPPSRTISSEL